MVEAIECDGVTKRYRGKEVLSDLTLRITGGICALLGANGAGKSTLLRLLTGLERPDAGSVRVLGFDVAERQTDLKQAIGVLPDSLGLFETLTVEENIECLGPIYGIGREETRMRVDSLLRLLELERGRRTLAEECSYGMRKKAALAMALVHRPRVLFLDEPFEGIDPSSSRAIERVLRDFAAKGGAVVMTSHILPLVERLATRTLVLGAGRVCWASDVDAGMGTLEETYFNLVGDAQGETPAWLA
jgi:ABC-2 type transport system ATP-binding protein